jgi:hypothetical protein
MVNFTNADVHGFKDERFPSELEPGAGAHTLAMIMMMMLVVGVVGVVVV